MGKLARGIMAIRDFSTILEGGPSALVAVAAIGLLALVYFIIVPVPLDPREPPLVRPRIPFVGHLLGLLRHSHGYHARLYRTHKQRVCTYPILGGKLYVVTDPGLAHSAILNRQLSFEPYVTEFIRRLTDLDETAMRYYEDPAFFSEWLKIVYSGLTGDNLLLVNTAAVTVICDSLNGTPEGGLEIPDLWTWTRDLITLASTTSLYGSRSPFRADPAVSEAYWAFEENLITLMPMVLPRYTSPRGYGGRNKVQQALTSYLAAEHDQDADVPRFTRDRMALERRFGFRPGEMAGLEVAVVHGAISNTIPTAAWVLLHAISDAALLADLRAEAEGVVRELPAPSSGRRTMAVSVARLEETCPLLYSVFRETQRLVSAAELNRRIMADTTITDGDGRAYLLKKGHNVQISYHLTQTRADLWGPGAAQFNGRRFLETGTRTSNGHAEKGGNEIPNNAFTPFGGGKHICPGRFFASGEIIGFLVPLILGFDLSAADGGPVPLPEVAAPWITTTHGKPVRGSDLRARLARRPGWEDVTWVVAK